MNYWKTTLPSASTWHAKEEYYNPNTSGSKQTEKNQGIARLQNTLWNIALIRRSNICKKGTKPQSIIIPAAFTRSNTQESCVPACPNTNSRQFKQTDVKKLSTHEYKTNNLTSNIQVATNTANSSATTWTQNLES